MNHMRLLLIVLMILVGFGVRADAEDSDWFRHPFGAEDTLGAFNYLSSRGVKNAAKLVKRGEVYQLGMVTGRTTLAYPPRKFQMIVHQLSDGSGTPLGSTETVGNDDTVITSIGIGSQIDGLGHIGRAHHYYNNRPVADVVAPDGLKLYGTHALPGIVTRGVLLDMARFYSQDPVADGKAYTEADIVSAARQQKVKIKKGDVVLLHSGYMQAEAMATVLKLTAPGLGVPGAEYLARIGVVAVGSDTWGLEVFPSEDATQAFPVHQTLLARNGVYILENMVTQPLVDAGVHEFMFVLGVPKLEGAVQAIINPIAIR